ncbi:hypothetical protein R5M92_07795 [Halomonas sp. Bachu 37]|uniref:hypothetical protein n=1 Tax=Halomonas kashgarensis TaxID=3084920 RepID=UPI003216D98F
MIKATIKRCLRPIIKKLITYPAFRRLGQRILAPFPHLKGWVIRTVQAGQYGSLAANNRIEGYGERQQQLADGLEQRWKQTPHE